MKLTMRESDVGNWFVIERAEHDGRIWTEQTGPNTFAFRTSARFSDLLRSIIRWNQFSLYWPEKHRQIVKALEPKP